MIILRPQSISPLPFLVGFFVVVVVVVIVVFYLTEKGTWLQKRKKNITIAAL